MSAVSSSDVILATGDAPWKVAVTPFRVMDQIYYSGNVWVGAYLIDTGEGLILLDKRLAYPAHPFLSDCVSQISLPTRRLPFLWKCAPMPAYPGAR